MHYVAANVDFVTEPHNPNSAYLAFYSLGCLRIQFWSRIYLAKKTGSFICAEFAEDAVVASDPPNIRNWRYRYSDAPRMLETNGDICFCPINTCRKGRLDKTPLGRFGNRRNFQTQRFGAEIWRMWRCRFLSCGSRTDSDRESAGAPQETEIDHFGGHPIHVSRALQEKRGNYTNYNFARRLSLTKI